MLLRCCEHVCVRFLHGGRETGRREGFSLDFCSVHSLVPDYVVGQCPEARREVSPHREALTKISRD
jgi:hypothetical protein